MGGYNSFFYEHNYKIVWFRGQPHVLPFNGPLRLGFVEVMWQLDYIDEDDLTKRGKGTFFPDYTIVPYFVVLKGGWVHFEKVLSPYCLRVSTKRHSDLEGFYAMFRKRIKGTQLPHQFNFIEDFVRNEFDLDK